MEPSFLLRPEEVDFGLVSESQRLMLGWKGQLTALGVLRGPLSCRRLLDTPYGVQVGKVSILPQCYLHIHTGTVHTQRRCKRRGFPQQRAALYVVGFHQAMGMLICGHR